MAGKRQRDDSIAGEEEVRRIEMKYASLKEDYLDLQRHSRASRKRAQRRTDKEKRLREEVRFLRRKYQMFTEKDREESAGPSVSPEFGAKSLSVHRKPKEPTELLAIEDEPTGLQPSAMRIVTALTVPHSLLVTPIVEPTNKKRCLKNNGQVSAQKPSKVKDGRNKKVKVAPFVSQECDAEILSISRKLKEPTEEDGLQLFSSTDDCPSGLQLFSSTDDCPSPKTPSGQPSGMGIMPAFAVPEASLVTSSVKPAIKKRLHPNNGLVSLHKPSIVKDSQRKKIKHSPQMPIMPTFAVPESSLVRSSVKPTIKNRLLKCPQAI